MIQSILDAISIRLNDVFGERYEIYTENVEQGLQEPCFFVRMVSGILTSLLADRRIMSYSFMITYFPTESETNDDMMRIGDQLTDEMEYVTTTDGDIIRGREISFEIDPNENVLHLNITYKVTMVREKEFIPMEDMRQETEVN